MNDRVSSPRGRVILAKAGLDAHERGVHVVAHGLRNAGFEVIYLGLRRTAEQVVAAALQEDADVIGLSSLAGGHRHFARAILELLEPVDLAPLIVVGGLIPPDDEREMLESGVALVFNVESPISDIVVALTEAVSERRRQLHA